MKNKNLYSSLLKRWMTENRYSISLFSEKIGISRSWCSLILHDKRIPSNKLKLVIEEFTNGEVKGPLCKVNS